MRQSAFTARHQRPIALLPPFPPWMSIRDALLDSMSAIAFFPLTPVVQMLPYVGPEPTAEPTGPGEHSPLPAAASCAVPSDDLPRTPPSNLPLDEPLAPAVQAGDPNESSECPSLSTPPSSAVVTPADHPSNSESPSEDPLAPALLVDPYFAPELAGSSVEHSERSTLPTPPSRAASSNESQTIPPADVVLCDMHPAFVIFHRNAKFPLITQEDGSKTIYLFTNEAEWLSS